MSGEVFKVLERLEVPVDVSKILDPSAPATAVYEEFAALRQAALMLRAQLSVALAEVPNPVVLFRGSQRDLTLDEKRSLYQFLGKLYDEDTSCLVSLKAFLKQVIDTIDFLIHEEEQKFANQSKEAKSETYDSFLEDYTLVQTFHNQLIDVVRTMRGDELRLTKMVN